MSDRHIRESTKRLRKCYPDTPTRSKKNRDPRTRTPKLVRKTGMATPAQVHVQDQNGQQGNQRLGSVSNRRPPGRQLLRRDPNRGRQSRRRSPTMAHRHLQETHIPTTRILPTTWLALRHWRTNRRRGRRHELNEDHPRHPHSASLPPGSVVPAGAHTPGGPTAVTHAAGADARAAAAPMLAHVAGTDRRIMTTNAAAHARRNVDTPPRAMCLQKGAAAPTRDEEPGGDHDPHQGSDQLQSRHRPAPPDAPHLDPAPGVLSGRDLHIATQGATSHHEPGEDAIRPAPRLKQPLKSSTPLWGNPKVNIFLDQERRSSPTGSWLLALGEDPLRLPTYVITSHARQWTVSLLGDTLKDMGVLTSH